MNQSELRSYLDKLVSTLEPQKRQLLNARLEGLISVFPFNEYEYILMYFLDKGILSFEEYEKLRDGYVKTNKYLGLFGLAPRIFGQIWGEAHLRDLDIRFVKPDRTLDHEYEGQYDLWISGTRVEVKACRAIHTKMRGDLVSKALSHDSSAPFWMNYQQLKLDICDAFVFIGVWVDTIVYWVLSNSHVKNSPTLSHQHRGGVEYQIGITNSNIRDFDKYLVEPSKIAETIISMKT